MAIIEYSGGPITHKYLMGKTKWELASMYMELMRLYEKLNPAPSGQSGEKEKE